MPTMADITVKASNGTTDVVYTGIVSSGGDKSPAIFRNNAASGAAGQRPELRVRSTATGAGQRKVEGSFTFPQLYTESTTGLTKVAGRANGSWNVSLPIEVVNDATLAEFAAQFGNLVASTLMKSVHTSGFAPT